MSTTQPHKKFKACSEASPFLNRSHNCPICCTDNIWRKWKLNNDIKQETAVSREMSLAGWFVFVLMTTASGPYWFWLKSYCWTFPFACKGKRLAFLGWCTRMQGLGSHCGTLSLFFFFFCLYLRVQPKSTKRKPRQRVIWEKGAVLKSANISESEAGALMDSFGNRHSVKSNLLERDQGRGEWLDHLHTLDWHSSKAKVVSLDIKVALRGSASFHIIKASSPISADLFSSLQESGQITGIYKLFSGF